MPPLDTPLIQNKSLIKLNLVKLSERDFFSAMTNVRRTADEKTLMICIIKVLKCSIKMMTFLTKCCFLKRINE